MAQKKAKVRQPPSEDPVLAKAVGEAEPHPDRLVKEAEKASFTAATGEPPAGRSGLDQARRQGPLGYLQLLGPGLITGASDDDPSGIGTYAQVGSQFGFGLLWTALFTFPMMAAVQELCARIALHTGVGLGVALRRKFPSWVVGIAIAALVIANTINIGADLGAVAAGGQLLSRGALHAVWLIVPVTALIIFFQLRMTYTSLFRIFKWLTLALFAYVITAFFTHAQLRSVVLGTVIPHLELSKDFLTALVAVLGTTISPYLFFWQASSEVDQMMAAGQRTEGDRRGVASKELKAARFDIITGMAFSNLIMYFIILTSAAVLHAHGKTDIATADQAAAALAPLAGPFAFILFSAGLIGAGMLAIPILAGSATYGVSEFLGLGGSLAFKPRYRPTFYAVLVLATVAGAAMNFLGLNPISALFITAVINGVVAPPLLVLIVLLGADRAFMGARTSRRLSLGITGLTTILMAIAAALMLVFLVVK